MREELALETEVRGAAIDVPHLRCPLHGHTPAADHASSSLILPTPNTYTHTYTQVQTHTQAYVHTHTGMHTYVDAHADTWEVQGGWSPSGWQTEAQEIHLLIHAHTTSTSQRQDSIPGLCYSKDSAFCWLEKHGFLRMRRNQMGRERQDLEVRRSGALLAPGVNGKAWVQGGGEEEVEEDWSKRWIGGCVSSEGRVWVAESSRQLASCV